MRAALGLVAILCIAAACSGDPETKNCPGQFDPGGLSDTELRRHYGELPESTATTEESVRATIDERRGFLERQYSGVVDVEAGEGWGVSYTRDELGNVTFHRKPDRMVVVTQEKRSDCRDPERGTVLLFTPSGDRVPVRFVYLAPKVNE